MIVAVTGATGYAGRFIVENLLAAGDEVIALTRLPPPEVAFSRPVRHRRFDLADPGSVDLSGTDALVHAALSHVPGRYRGGEGDDPAGFLRRNVEGSARLFHAAGAAGLRRIVFLSSRAVYGPKPPGTPLREDMACAPDTLYGQAKLAAEDALRRCGLRWVSLRATGIYGSAGPGRSHKWAGLFADFAAGRPIAPRVGTEVHGADLAALVRLALTGAADALPDPVLNASDILLDRADLLALWGGIAGIPHAPPPRADAASFNVPDTGRARSLGWAPGGMARLEATLRALAAAEGRPSPA